MKRFGLGRFFHRGGGQEAQATREVKEVVPAAAERLKPNPGTTVLVVDDSKTIQVVLTRLLSRHGYETLSAYDGDSAVELAREHQPALVLMDVVMPGLNGFQATREIRRDPNPAVANMPVIIMSGNAQPTEEFWSVKIKANGFMSKPFSDDELFSRIEKLLFTDSD
jgi:twitching motility two-component system response regulator PilH